MSKIRNGTEEEFNAMRATIRLWNETYAVNMLQLQEICGLTYREARAFLIEYRENNITMAQDLDIDIHAIYNLKRKAKKKIEASGLTLEEIFGDHMPVSRGHILPSPVAYIEDLKKLRHLS